MARRKKARVLSGLIEARALETFINLHPSTSAGDKTLAEERNKAYFLFLFFVNFSVYAFV